MILSIIIPMYKVEQYIEKCLLSTQNQDIEKYEYEIVVVNDGSPDNSLTIAEKLALQYENIHVYTKENGGLSSARNFGISKAKGEYIFFLDSDDWIADNCLGELVAQLKIENPDVLCICAANTDGITHKRRFEFNDTTPMPGRDFLRTGWFVPCAPFYIVKSSLLKSFDLHFYEGILHEDSEYMPRMLYFAQKVSFTNRIIYWVYQNPNSITRTINPKKSFDLLNFVCERLSDFSQHVDKDTKVAFDDLISMYINNSLAFILKCDKEKQNEINQLCASKKHLWRHLKVSSKRKYRIEYKLFSLIPNHPLLAYKLMKKLS